MKLRNFMIAFALGAGCVFLLLKLSGQLSPAAQANSAAEQSPDEGESLRAEIERLKQMVPDQAHAMQDVDYHFTNLWFAGKAENWPLAEFYWKETISHIRWAIRIIPVRKNNAGQEVKLEEIFQSIVNAPHLQLSEVIEQRNAEKFEPTYRSVLEACYSCHKASDKPYLRPQIPHQPATAIINFDTEATWPQ